MMSLMKKLSAILFLGLLSACSNKVDKAIEKCADIQTIMGSSSYLRSEFKKLLINPEYQETVMLINKLKKTKEINYKKAEIEYSKYNKENPEPKSDNKFGMPGIGVWSEWLNSSSKKRKEIFAPYYKSKEDIARAESFQLNVIRKLVREDLKKKNLKQKSIINKYNKNFEKCEKEQKKAPKSFMLNFSK